MSYSSVVCSSWIVRLAVHAVILNNFILGGGVTVFETLMRSTQHVTPKSSLEEVCCAMTDRRRQRMQIDM